MGVRRISAIAIALLLFGVTRPGFAQGRWTGRATPAQVLEVCESGCGFTTICGATCTASPYVCASGSALASITDSTVTNRYTIKVHGFQDECVMIDKPGISLLGDGPGVSRIRKSVAVSTDQRLGSIVVTPAADGLEIAHLWIQNDTRQHGDSNPPGAAILIADNGTEATTCTTTDCITDFNIHDNVIVSLYAGIRMFGSALGATTGLRTGRIHDNVIITGQFGIQDWGFGDTDIYGNRFLTDQTYCQDANYASGESATYTGDVACSGGCTTTGFNVTNNLTGIADKENLWRGHTVIMADPNGATGTCPAAVHNERRQIESYIASTDRVTVDRAFSGTPTVNCTFTILGTPFIGTTSSGSFWGPTPCTDVDWNTLDVDTGFSGGPAYGVWMKAGPMAALTMDRRYRMRIHDNSMTIRQNQGGGESGYKCSSRVATSGVSINAPAFDHEITGNDISVEINTPLQEQIFAHPAPVDCTASVDCCARKQVAGIILAGDAANTTASAQFEAIRTSNTIRVTNNADPNLNIYGVLAQGAAVYGGQLPTIDVGNSMITLQNPVVWAKKSTAAGSRTDLTSAARSTTDAAVAMFPSVLTANDYFMIGFLHRNISEFTFDLSTVAGTATFAWEFWSTTGSTWAAFPANATLTDGTAGLTTDGTLVFTPNQSVNYQWSDETQTREKMMWIRAKVTNAGDGTIPTLNSITIANGTTYHVGAYDAAVARVGNVVAGNGYPIKTDGTIVRLSTLGAGLTGSITANFNLAALGCEVSSNITIDGAALGDTCIVGAGAALPSTAVVTCEVTAANTVVVKHCTPTTSNPADMTYTVRVAKP